MYRLPPDNALSLRRSREERSTNSTALSSESHPHSSALPEAKQLPPLYAETLNDELIEAHKQLAQELEELRTKLLREPPDSFKRAMAPLQPEAGQLNQCLADIRGAFSGLVNMARNLAKLRTSTDEIQEVASRLEALKTDDAPSKDPAFVIQEVSDCLKSLRI